MFVLAGKTPQAHKEQPVRRFVRDRIVTALERARPTLEDYISRHLAYPLGFPGPFDGAAVLIREFRQIKVTAVAKADLPPVQIEATLKAWLSNRVVQIGGEWDPGLLDADVQLTAGGTVNPDGSYGVEPRTATLKAWWRDMGLTFSPTRK